jgi:hypothetical protein
MRFFTKHGKEVTKAQAIGIYLLERHGVGSSESALEVAKAMIEEPEPWPPLMVAVLRESTFISRVLATED